MIQSAVSRDAKSSERSAGLDGSMVFEHKRSACYVGGQRSTPQRERNMTEAEWLECTDPSPMLDFLQGTASDRKLRLFAVACCRRAPYLFRDEPSRNALDLIERFSDGRASASEFESLLNVNTAELGGERVSQVLIMKVPAWWKITMALQDVKTDEVAKLANELTWRGKRDESMIQSRFAHCIFGNPFRPVALDPCIRSPKIVELANDITNIGPLLACPFLPMP